MKAALQAIEDTKLAIEQYGWVQGRYGSIYGGMCIDGALRFAISGSSEADFDRDSVYWEARRAISTVAETSLVRWNDNPQRTQEDVVALLERVCIRLRGL